MILALEIAGIWLAASIISAPVVIPFLARRFAKHEGWVKR